MVERVITIRRAHDPHLPYSYNTDIFNTWAEAQSNAYSELMDHENYEQARITLRDYDGKVVRESIILQGDVRRNR